VLDCVPGAVPCTGDPCIHCDEDTDSCAWCILDLNASGFVDGLDFGFFSGCFGACYTEADPCYDANFDEVPTNCVGTGDFAPFAGCFGLDCASCGNCSGPPTLGTIAVADPIWSDPVTVRLVAVETPHDSDFLHSEPASRRWITAGEEFYLEVWASRTGGPNWSGEALASVYTDIAFDPSMLAVAEVVPSGAFSTLASGAILGRTGQALAVGGCATLGETSLGVDSVWVRVAVLRAFARTSGGATITLESAGDLYGVSIVGRHGNVEVSEIVFEGLDLQIFKPLPDRGPERSHQR
jgi:hypothetical protein